MNPHGMIGIRCSPGKKRKAYEVSALRPGGPRETRYYRQGWPYPEPVENRARHRRRNALFRGPRQDPESENRKAAESPRQASPRPLRRKRAPLHRDRFEFHRSRRRDRHAAAERADRFRKSAELDLRPERQCHYPERLDEARL